MKLTVHIDENQHEIEVPELILSDATDYFDMMDNDMDNGHQMSRTWVEKPDQYQRCQIVGDRLLTAVQSKNRKTCILMAGYLLKRVPNIKALMLTQRGDMLEHEIEV